MHLQFDLWRVTWKTTRVLAWKDLHLPGESGLIIMIPRLTPCVNMWKRTSFFSTTSQATCKPSRPLKGISLVSISQRTWWLEQDSKNIFKNIVVHVAYA